ncbi:Or35a [Drosophila busckii]|uniref:Odorant receptor n=1 Tax=Drosophila busckii TaxID=30019 RepID=A0A0M4E9H8_DROBS|nr:odorant receptor 35a [Drosophila busckii]ALC39802.1 Or35a [Drosophila busckii]
MVRFVPRLANGEVINISWSLRIYRSTNHIFWPLDGSTSNCRRWLNYLLVLLGLLIYLLHTDLELRYIRTNVYDLDAVLTGMPTFLILIEAQLRSFHALRYREDLRQLLQRFFTQIYVPRQQHAQLFRQVERRLIIIRTVAASFLIAALGYISAPVFMLIKQQRSYIFPMVPGFSDQSLFVFVPLVLSSAWVALSIGSMEFGEPLLICELTTHLKARYELLQRDLEQSTAQLLKAPTPAQVSRQLRQVLVATLRRNMQLNQFAQQVEHQFTVRVFIMFAFSTLLLCTLCFKTYTNPTAGYIYPVWFVSKTLEIMALGQLGSDLAFQTDTLSTMYYECNWEQALFHSSDPQENLRLLKVVLLAIELNSQPFYMTGLKYFRVSLQAGLKILQGAFSYFTFLTSMR